MPTPPRSAASRRPLWQPPTSWLAAVWLVATGGLLLFGRTELPAKPALTLPRITPRAGCMLFESSQLFTTIHLDSQGRAFLTFHDTAQQTRIVQALARQRHLRLTPRQVQELSRLPYWGLNADQLAQYFTLSRAGQWQLNQQGIPQPPAADQLAELLALASVAPPQYSAHFLLRADQQTSYQQLRRVISLLPRSAQARWKHVLILVDRRGR